jgi:hypothetical protein
MSKELPEIIFSHTIMGEKHILKCNIKNNLEEETEGIIEFPGTSIQPIKFYVNPRRSACVERDAPMEWGALPYLITFTAPEDIRGCTSSNDGQKRSIWDRILILFKRQ